MMGWRIRPPKPHPTVTVSDDFHRRCARAAVKQRRTVLDVVTEAIGRALDAEGAP